MPTYEYACKNCGTHIEVVQSFSDEPLTTCEACRGELRKVIYPAGILFRGSGFYSTDRRAALTQSKSGSKDKAKETSTGDASKKKESGDKAGKPEAKAAATSGNASTKTAERSA